MIIHCHVKSTCKAHSHHCGEGSFSCSWVASFIAASPSSAGSSIVLSYLPQLLSNFFHGWPISPGWSSTLKCQTQHFHHYFPVYCFLQLWVQYRHHIAFIIVLESLQQSNYIVFQSTTKDSLVKTSRGERVVEAYPSDGNLFLNTPLQLYGATCRKNFYKQYTKGEHIALGC